MVDEIIQVLDPLLGLNADTLNWYQVSARAFLIYIAALVMVRVGEKRSLGKNTAFDVILGIILVGLHWLFAFLAFRSDWFGDLIKGIKRQIVSNGEILWTEMEKSNISREDLLSAVRTETNLEELGSVQKAYLERSGNISVIRRRQEPKVLELKVTEGVQTIRIQIK